MKAQESANRAPATDHTGSEVANDDSEQLEVRRTLRLVQRLVVSAHAILSFEEVVRNVGGRSAEVRDWLQNAVVPLRHPTGRRVYLWGDVVDAMRRAA